MRKQLLIRLESKTKEQIRKLAKADKRDMNAYVLILLENHIDEVSNAK